MTTTQTVADKLRSHPDLAGYAATERGHRFLTGCLAEQREFLASFTGTRASAEQRIENARDLIRKADEAIERCSMDAIDILERVLGGNFAA